MHAKKTKFTICSLVLMFSSATVFGRMAAPHKVERGDLSQWVTVASSQSMRAKPKARFVRRSTNAFALFYDDKEVATFFCSELASHFRSDKCNILIKRNKVRCVPNIDLACTIYLSSLYNA